MFSSLVPVLGGLHAGTTWDPSNKSASITLSNGNLTEATTGASIVRSVLSKSSGKWYWEVTVTANDSNMVIGICDGTQTLTNSHFPGDSTHSWAFYSGGTKVTNSSFTAYGSSYGVNGNVIGVALDITNGFIYFAINNVWQNSGVPTSGATGTGAAFSGLTGTYYAAAGSGGSAGTATANFGSSTMAYSPPAGYSGGIF